MGILDGFRLKRGCIALGVSALFRFDFIHPHGHGAYVDWRQKFATYVFTFLHWWRNEEGRLLHLLVCWLHDETFAQTIATKRVDDAAYRLVGLLGGVACVLSCFGLVACMDGCCCCEGIQLNSCFWLWSWLLVLLDWLYFYQMAYALLGDGWLFCLFVVGVC